MSAADEAWQEWRTRFGQYTIEGDDRESFLAGYRRALEDAAAFVDADTDGDALDYWLGIRSMDKGLREGLSDWLRARAAAVAPRETKD